MGPRGLGSGFFLRPPTSPYLGRATTDPYGGRATHPSDERHWVVPSVPNNLRWNLLASNHFTPMNAPVCEFFIKKILEGLGRWEVQHTGAGALTGASALTCALAGAGALADACNDPEEGEDGVVKNM